MLRGDDRVTGVEHHERAGAVRALGLGAVEAGLPKQCGLLIAGDAVDRDPIGEAWYAARAPEQGRARPHFGEDGHGHVQLGAHFFAPAPTLQWPEHRARGVTRFGYVGRAPGQAPDQVRVDGAGGELAVFGSSARAFDMIEDPRQLGGGEVRVEDQTGGCPHAFGESAAAQLLAAIGGAAILPDDCAVNRSPIAA